MRTIITAIFFLILFIANTEILYSQAGQLDSTFGQNGIVTTAVNVKGSGKIASSALQSDGKIVAGGSVHFDGQSDFILARYNPNGTLDYSFGTGGIVITDIGDMKNNGINSVKIQQDGKILAAGYSNNGTDNNFALARYNPDGTLDKYFGNYGIVTTEICWLIGGTTPANDSVSSLAIQEDGKIVAAGSTLNVNDDFCLVRYNPDGSVDSTFGTNGAAVLSGESSSDCIYSIAIQPDGKILAGGRSDILGTFDFALARYDSNGILDHSFNETGVVITHVVSEDAINSIALQTDGKIVAAGYSDFYGSKDFIAVRYYADGSVDTSFGTNGVAGLVVGSSEEIVNALALQPAEGGEEKIIVSGYSDYGGDKDFTSLRFNSMGILDNTFGISGIKITELPNMDEVNSLIIQPDGMIVASGGSLNVEGWKFTSVRYTPDGEEDASFGKNGVVITPVGEAENVIHSIAIQSDGKIVAAGSVSNGTDDDFIVIRYNTNGTPDSSFSEDGIVITQIGLEDEYANSIAIQADGKIVAAGSYYNGADQDFALVRYNIDGSLDDTFDEDGISTAQTGTSYEEALSVAIQPDGRIIAGGYTMNSVYGLYSARYNQDGSLDRTFGDHGVVYTPIGTWGDGIHSLLIQGDGKIAAVGYAGTSMSNSDFALVRYNNDGSFDDTFGDNGIVTTQVSTQYDRAFSAALQSDGKIVAGGFSSPDAGDEEFFTLIRYNSNGTLDSSFGTNGIVKTAIGEVSGVRSVSIQSDGKIIAAGEAYYRVALARYNIDGSLDNSFGADGTLSTSTGAAASVALSSVIQSDGKIILAGDASDTPYNSRYCIFNLVRYLGDPPTDVREEKISKLPSSFTLEQNYPNPFNPVTNFRFRVPPQGRDGSDFQFVSLKIYDILGNEVAVLVNEEKEPGEYKIQFNAEGLSSGVYFYRLTAVKFSETKKMILIR